MTNLTDILEGFRLLTWEEKIEAMRPLRRGSRVLIFPTQRYRLSKTGVFRLKREFRKQVCDFNRRQPIDQPIRSIFSGEFVYPGTAIYTRSMRACRIERIHSTCREILSRDPFPHPRTGAPLSANSVLGRKLRRKCSK